MTTLDELDRVLINTAAAKIFEQNKSVGWWDGGVENRNMGEIIALIHSEISEALEGVRKNKMDDHLPHRKNFDVELADAMIRILDVCGAKQIPIGDIISEKLEYNKQRADHKRENRAKDGGKKF